MAPHASRDRDRPTLALDSPDPGSTRAIGEILGATAPDGAVVLLVGPLGAGKTTFAQGVGRGCGVEGPIASPTYNLILHHAGERPFTHVDLYRLDSVEDLETLDVDEIVSGDGVTCVEWPDKIAPRVAPPFARVELEPLDMSARNVRIRLTGEGWEATRRALRDSRA